jgi:hypothetical protein
MCWRRGNLPQRKQGIVQLRDDAEVKEARIFCGQISLATVLSHTYKQNLVVGLHLISFVVAMHNSLSG